MSEHEVVVVAVVVNPHNQLSLVGVEERLLGELCSQWHGRSRQRWGCMDRHGDRGEGLRVVRNPLEMQVCNIDTML